MTRRLPTTLAAGALAVGALAAPALAQSVTVIGTGEAQACFQAATFGETSRDALESCDYALDNERLRRRDRAATYVNRGVIHVAREEFQFAFDDYEMAREMMPEFPEIYLNRGNVYFHAERWDEAIADYEEAMARGLRQEHIAVMNRGMAREASGDLEGAESDYLHALEIVPDWSPAQQKLNRVRGKIAERAERANGVA
jgi:tetratricopeptide (TPR) repeat protein